MISFIPSKQPKNPTNKNSTAAESSLKLEPHRSCLCDIFYDHELESQPRLFTHHFGEKKGRLYHLHNQDLEKFAL